jgi:hypothetical protein
MQLFLNEFPVGGIHINSKVCILTKEGVSTYFVGTDNYFNHKDGDKFSEKFIIASLIDNDHVTAREVQATLDIPYRTLMNWGKQLRERGHDSFFQKRKTRSDNKMIPSVVTECEHLLKDNIGVPQVAALVGVNVSTLRKAIKRGKVVVNKSIQNNTIKNESNKSSIIDMADVTKVVLPIGTEHCELGSIKSTRSRTDANAAEEMGVACTRSSERMGAAVGLLQSAATRYERCMDVSMGGLLAGLPALCANGLYSGLDKHFSLPKGFYSACQILTLLGYMALARIKRPEGLRHIPPGELGKTIGLDRVPEVRTLRKKIKIMAETGSPEEWMRDISKQWMDSDPDEAGYLYLDGHVRVYSGKVANLPKRYVSRMKLCLSGTTDYWVNDAIGQPFFVVSKAVTTGLADALSKDIVPVLLDDVPNQPSDTELEEDLLLHRFVVVFDREGSNHALLSKLWENRIGAITYRKSVKDSWPVEDFKDTEVPVPGGGSTTMKLAFKETQLASGNQSITVLEVRRLTDTGHQTAVISTARRLRHSMIAGRMFARWCQENFFGYMMEHFDIDGLVQYGAEDIPGTTEVVNPEWRILEKAINKKRTQLQKLHAKLCTIELKNDEKNIQVKADLLQDILIIEDDIQGFRNDKKGMNRKVKVSDLPPELRPSQLTPLGKQMTDTIKMIAYRAETALVALIKPHLNKEADARALIRELFVTDADLYPNDQNNTLTVRIHHMASPVHDRAIDALLSNLNDIEFIHPDTGMKLLYELV